MIIECRPAVGARSHFSGFVLVNLGAGAFSLARYQRGSGYFGYFSDPDGHLCKVACSS